MRLILSLCLCIGMLLAPAVGAWADRLWRNDNDAAVDNYPMAPTIFFVGAREAGFKGSWETDRGNLLIDDHQGRLVGRYPEGKGRIEGVVSPDGLILAGMWMEAPTYIPIRDGGMVSLHLADDGQTFSGHWWYGVDSLKPGGEWNGRRTRLPAGMRGLNPCTVTDIKTYHHNQGKGVDAPGSISLLAENGQIYGPWDATGHADESGAPNAYWTVTPNITLPPGEYRILDSDVATWSHNAESGYQGFAVILGTCE